MSGFGRGRITIPDLVFILMSVAVLAALWPVFIDLFEDNIDHLPTGAALFWQMILPLSILVLFNVIYLKSVRGMR